MKLYYVRTGLLAVNSYFLVDENTRETVLIDCGEYYNQIQNIVKKYDLKIKALLLTHAHFDHSGCAKKIQDDGARVYISELDGIKIQNGQTLSNMFAKEYETLTPDYIFSDGEVLHFTGFDVKVMLTPGHTDGSAVFIAKDMIFSGDTLFNATYGRTDFPTGDEVALKKSIYSLFALEGDYNVYPGHNEFTKLSVERLNNPIKYL